MHTWSERGPFSRSSLSHISLFDIKVPAVNKQHLLFSYSSPHRRPLSGPVTRRTWCRRIWSGPLVIGSSVTGFSHYYLVTVLASHRHAVFLMERTLRKDVIRDFGNTVLHRRWIQNHKKQSTWCNADNFKLCMKRVTTSCVSPFKLKLYSFLLWLKD